MLIMLVSKWLELDNWNKKVTVFDDYNRDKIYLREFVEFVDFIAWLYRFNIGLLESNENKIKFKNQILFLR